jgi:antitoxin Phd
LIKRQNRWQLQEAKNKLSEVVRRAQTEGPQTITVRGEDAVVVVASDEYSREHRIPERAPSQSLGSFLRRSPLWGSGVEFDRDLDSGRDIALPEL